MDTTIPDSITVKLSKPIEHADKQYDELTFEEATAGDLAVVDSVSGETTRMLAILASMSGVPLQVIKKIKARDLTRIIKEVEPLMGEQEPPAGQTS
ncbi:phage tail assembly protein [Rhizobium sp. CFBP 8762]|uniref:phage tail assembly protein n=1 Tax=Rhizobium sp. CFBP 8762 TaxID=2775279 RepID=UPI00177D6D2E|nr:phage tail assembly protein [Rhizobium sp. CFBP 8762]MBD8556914.1 phage tail assembly protein [Rhizobium sp. CFBP 8762]